MAKILISFLGVGRTDRSRVYNTARYRLEEFEMETRFIADFLIQAVKPEKVYLFGTPKSMWEEVYSTFSKKWNNYDTQNEDHFFNYVLTSTKDTEIHEPSFFQLLSDSSSGITILPKLIHYGLNEKELKINSEKILSIGTEINPKDEVYIDITHAFRSIPMYSLLLVGLLRQLKGLKVKDIYYGMHEATSEVGYTPVVSLFPLIQLFDWITAAKSFNDFGSSRGLIDLMKQNNINVNAIKTTRKWAICQQINDNKAYKEASFEFVKELTRLDPKVIPSELKLLTPYLQYFPSRLSAEDVEWKRLVLLSKHNQKSDNIGLAVLNLWEAIVSRFEDIFEVKVNNDYEVYRKISKFLRGFISPDDQRLIERLVKPDIQIFFKNCQKLSLVRNAVAHGNAILNDENIKSYNEIDYPRLIADIGDLLDNISKQLHDSAWNDGRLILKQIFKDLK